MKQFISISKALSDSNRVRILLALREGEICVCRLIELLKLAPSTVSKHLTVLRQAGLIEGRKEGRWMHYRLPTDPRSEERKALEWVFQSLEHTPEALADRQRIKQIQSTDINELTQIYK